MKSTRPLYQSLALQFSLVAIAPVIIIGVLVFIRVLPEFDRDLSDRSRNMAEAVGQQVELFLQSPRVLLESLRADAMAGLELSATQQLNILDTHVTTTGLFEALYLVDVDGRVVSVGLQPQRRTFRDDYLGLDMGGKDFVNRARQTGEIAWSDTFLSVVSGRISVAVALPVGETVLVGDFIIDRLEDFVSRLSIENRVQPIVVDRRGQIIAHPQANLGSRQLNISHLQIIKTALAGDSSTQRFMFDDTEFIGTVVNIPGPNWAALIAQPLDDAYRSLVTTGQILLMGAVIALLLAITAAILLARRFARPVETLANHAKIIADGDYSDVLPQFRSREINELARDFKRMVDAIREREHKLVSGERKYREIFNATNEAIFVHDAATGELVDVNETMLEMFGYTHEEALGVGVVRFSGEYEYDVSDEVLERIRSAAKGMPQVFEWKCRRKDGGYFTAEVTLKAVHIDDHLRVLAVVRDITDRKRAQEALRVLNMELEARVEQRTAELSAANKAKTEFLSKMSHELRTPLNAVIGLSEMLLEDAQENSEEHLEEPLQRILGAGQHLLVLINDILDLAKIESGYMELHIERVTIDEMLDGVVTTVSPLVAQNNNRFDAKINNADVEVQADVTKVRQILFNLLSNASKFTENGVISLEVSSKDRWINFAVKDSGVGIPRDFLPHLFEEFMQSGASTANRQEGTGLGLPICQRLCDLMGGEIYAESEEGVGSTFFVRLPLEVEKVEIQASLTGAESKRA